ncbi:ArsR/SmtB family transcription factor [Blastomonas sp.]|uniref:ArsR/SmtB family transcription factor n=1 Tax=Blastomonas sp. TaxID=1909299 RepID=UPI003592F2C5
MITTGSVKGVPASPLDDLRSPAVLGALAALAQEHRLAAFRLLVEAGPDGVSAGDLADRLAVPRSSLSFHLSQLMAAGLIIQRRESRSLIYSADYAAMGDLIAFLTENCCRSGGC